MLASFTVKLSTHDSALSLKPDTLFGSSRSGIWPTWESESGLDVQSSIGAVKEVVPCVILGKCPCWNARRHHQLGIIRDQMKDLCKMLCGKAVTGEGREAE